MRAVGWVLAAALVASCATAAAPPSPTSQPSPSPDLRAAAAAAYLSMVDRMAARVTNFSAPPNATDVERLTSALRGQMQEIIDTFPKITWPADAKPYADDLLEAATTFDTQLSSIEINPSNAAMSSMTDVLGKIRAKILLLRQALQLPPAPSGGPIW